MHFAALSAACILLGAPLTAALQTDGRDPKTIPQLEVPEPPTWEDVDHPAFEPYPVEDALELKNGAIFEQFVGSPDELSQKWQVSKAMRNGNEPYEGEWAFEEPERFRGFDGDAGLVLKSESTAAAIARKIDPSIDVSSSTQPWVVQYEVKHQQPLRCGGAYLKLLPETSEADWSQFSNETPYLVMFGPDKCGSTDKVHFIVRHNGEEHHLVSPPRTRSGLLSTLYTLVVNEDQSFEIRIDGVTVREGSLLDPEEFDPPFTPAKEIDDPEDVMPADWDDEELIPDPDEPEKPADWDEDAPYLIHDPEANKPEKWREDVPLFIVDPEAKKPEFWDEEEDGVWSPPEIVNPVCVDLNSEEGEGCGEWLAPLVKNPSYKGKWSQPMILNPNFKGFWEPRRIPNPEYDEKAYSPGKLDGNIGGVGFEILAVQGNILFDNIYIGHSLRDAENLGNATWSPKYYIEAAEQSRANEAYRKQAEENAEPLDSGRSLFDKYRDEIENFKLDPLGYSADTYNDFIDYFRVDKVDALKQFPITALIASLAACLITAGAFGAFNVLLFMLTGKKNPQSRATVPVVPKEKEELSGSSDEDSSEETSR